MAQQDQPRAGACPRRTAPMKRLEHFGVAEAGLSACAGGTHGCPSSARARKKNTRTQNCPAFMLRSAKTSASSTERAAIYRSGASGPVAQCREAVAQLRRPLEVERLGARGSCRLADDPVPSGDRPDRNWRASLDQLAIGLDRNLAGTGRRAAFDLDAAGRGACAPCRSRVGAGAEEKRLLHDVIVRFTASADAKGPK